MSYPVCRIFFYKSTTTVVASGTMEWVAATMSLLVNMFVYLQHACAQMLLHCVDKWKKTVLGLFLLCFLSGGYFDLVSQIWLWSCLLGLAWVLGTIRILSMWFEGFGCRLYLGAGDLSSAVVSIQMLKFHHDYSRSLCCGLHRSLHMSLRERLTRNWERVWI